MVRLFSSKANPVQFDRVKPAASLSQQQEEEEEESGCAWDCGGTSPKMSRSPERTAPQEEPNSPAVGPAD